MFARMVAAPADPLALALRVAERPHLAFLHASARRPGLGLSYLACDPDEESRALDPLGERPGERGSALASVPRFVGVLPYEALRAIERPRWSPPDDRPLARASSVAWLGYPAVARIDPADGSVLVAGKSRGAVLDLTRRLETPRAPSRAPRVRIIDDEPAAAHVERVERAIELIRAGDLYQVSLARRIGLALAGDTEQAALLALFARLSRAAPSPFGMFLALPDAVVLSTSPELCLRAEASSAADTFGALVTEPIKGTRPRGVDAVDDARLARELDRDPKERAELAMIVDVERNDLNRVSVPGTVRLVAEPHVVTHRTIHHRVATLRSTVKAGVGREAVLRAMLPSGSVTGAPKIRAMEVIRSLEPMRRGLYTGAMGFAAHDGSMTLSMAIRTSVLDPDGTAGEYLVGGGIVVDSSPRVEWEETRWKARQLEALATRE
jgi:anthranilate/para-aminobenzoate synthase component I